MGDLWSKQTEFSTSSSSTRLIEITSNCHVCLISWLSRTCGANPTTRSLTGFHEDDDDDACSSTAVYTLPRLTPWSQLQKQFNGAASQNHFIPNIHEAARDDELAFVALTRLTEAVEAAAAAVHVICIMQMDMESYQDAGGFVKRKKDANDLLFNYQSGKLQVRLAELINKHAPHLGLKDSILLVF